MNRLERLASGPSTVSDLRSDAAQAIFQQSPSETPFSLFAPLHYEPNYAYPLLVWLHGCRGDERQLLRVMPLVSMRNYVGVAPRGPLTAEGSRPAYAWLGQEVDFAEAERRVAVGIEAAADRFHIASDRIFLAGCGEGGQVALQLALRQPERFAGAVTLGGPFPSEHAPLARIKESRRVPLMIMHGRDSRDYPVEQLCQHLRLFHAAGMSVTVRQYPCGDEVTTKMLSDLDTWLMEQVTGQEAAATR